MSESLGAILAASKGTPSRDLAGKLRKWNGSKAALKPDPKMTAKPQEHMISLLQLALSSQTVSSRDPPGGAISTRQR